MERGGFSTQIHIRHFDIGEKSKSRQLLSSKICHNSDLKITKCTSGFPLVENGLWKTLWKVWKSTLKRGVSAGLLHVLHRVFNLWKKQDPFTNLYTGLFVENTHRPANGTDILPGSWQHFFHARAWRLGVEAEKFLWKKKPQFYGKESPLMLYFKMNQYRILSQTDRKTFRDAGKRLSHRN